MECGDVTPLWFLCFSFMECGAVTPLWFLCLAWQRTQTKNRTKHEKQRNKSGVTSPHSINNATSKRVLRAQRKGSLLPHELSIVVVGIMSARSEERRVGKECR